MVKKFYVAKLNGETLDHAILEYTGSFPVSKELCILDMLEGGYNRSDYKVYEVTISDVNKAVSNARRIV